MRLYPLIGRLIHPGAVVYFKIHNRFIRQPRARVIVCNELDEVLLVKTWIGHDLWSLPGGGVERNEAPVAAARRELREEIGLDIASERFRYMETIRIHGYEAPIYTVQIARVDLIGTAYDKREITHIGWYKMNNLPEVFPSVADIIQKLARQE